MPPWFTKTPYPRFGTPHIFQQTLSGDRLIDRVLVKQAPMSQINTDEHGCPGECRKAADHGPDEPFSFWVFSADVISVESPYRLPD